MTDDQYDRAARAHWEKHSRSPNLITGKPNPMTAADRVDIERMAGKLRRDGTTPLDAPVVERCRLSELPKDSCSHCRPPADRPPIKVGGRHRLFESRYPGTCAVCGEPYRAGVIIARLVDEQGYAHPDCTEEAP